MTDYKEANYYNLIEYILNQKIKDGVPIEEIVKKLEIIIRTIKDRIKWYGIHHFWNYCDIDYSRINIQSK